jgi:hypothetical protein
MHDIKKYICNELDDLEKNIKEKGGLTPVETQHLTNMLKAKEKLLKIEQMEDDDKGSYRGSYRGSYDDRMSYAEPMYADDERTERSRYSTRRDRMGRYSREDGYSRDEGMIEELRNMMGDLPANKQRELQQLIKRYER